MRNKLYLLKYKLQKMTMDVTSGIFGSKSEGIDGILVTVGLCIIALLLCVVMKDSLTTFIQTLVKNMQDEAQRILGVSVTP